MFKKKYLNDIQNKVLDMSSDSISLVNDIKNLSEITYDYCAYNENNNNSNIMTITEIIKEKSCKLINIIDLFSIEIINYNKK